MAMSIPNTLVVRGGIGPMSLHLGNARVHGAAAIYGVVSMFQLIRSERQQRAEHIPELVHGKVLACLEVVVNTSLEVLVKLTIGGS
jgi:hypothetical protein